MLDGCAALRDSGADVVVGAIVNAGDPGGHGATFLGVAARRGLATVFERRHRFDMTLIARVREATRGRVVHAHGVLALSTAHLAVSAHRVVATAHGFTSQSVRVQVSEAVEVALCQRSAVVCAVSSVLAHDLEARGVSSSSLTVVTNPVAIRAPLAAPPPSSAARLAFVGRLSPEKNLETLLRASSSMARHDRPQIDIIGDGPLRGALEAYARRELPDTVRFHGWRDDMDDILERVDAVVLPSLREGTPLVLLEAATRGRPFLATAVGGVPALVAAGAAGMLVSGVDVETWRVALGKFAGHHRQLAAAARAAMPRWRELASPARWAAETRRIYARVIEAGAVLA